MSERLKLTREQLEKRFEMTRAMKDAGKSLKDIHQKLHEEGLAPKKFAASLVYAILGKKVAKKQPAKKAAAAEKPKADPWTMQDVRAHLLKHMAKHDLSTITFHATGHVLGEPVRRLSELMRPTD